MKKSNVKVKWCCLVWVVAAFVFYAGQFAWAADIVSGRYVSSSGNTIELALDIHSPSPVSLIIEQYLPPGTRIDSSQPKLKKYNIKKGKAKWLLKNIRSGKVTVKLRLADKIGKGNVRALLRCKDPATGGFIEKSVTP